MNTEPLLYLEGLTAGYGDTVVLRDLTIEVPRGRVVAVLGPNGHGKSTLLKTISGLLHPRSGRILYEGLPIERRRADEIVAAGIVHIPQGDLVFADMTVRENLFAGAYLPEAYRDRNKRLEHVYGMFPRLRERSGQLAQTLSGGERRMLALGRGLMSRARLLMIDEPSLGLAPLVTEEIYETIRRLKDDNRAILLVEENPERVFDTADHAYLIDHGAVVWQGSPMELQANDRIVSTYLGV